ncbi:MFS transporter [Domibacillus sp. DTU_2020_1001157_1_SI_ALB_TIR_016]|uniref:MFS transporter n=1 Tax=Domibacillus sp. DTU_2020_1001157_1_SI_ALB_TIR_016 TaxID=3077789 RepID=UPI0028EF835A|nr:MFS transporter [Domibacillus sp. DTU_2020_1001157_1_SI_ALB_TIR_016]WNS79553.1 MFS transporter [Domibacillus sp. DTU_2020_1001157_1_SI_ALB_TIR_016]
MNAISKKERGLPAAVIWGYVATLIFMVGDGLEHGWLSPYLVEQGLTVQQSATLFTAYGAVLAIASYFSGVLTEALGPRRVMLAGLLLWLVGQILFIEFGLKDHNYAWMLPTYALRGFGYPLFCYSFLVWVTYRSPDRIMATAVGLFWAAWSGGLYVVGSYFPAYMIPKIGYIGLMWSAVVWVVLGGIVGLLVVKDEGIRSKGNSKEKMKSLLSGLTICVEKPKVAIGGIVRIINSTGIGALPIFFPLYLSSEYGFSTGQWLQVWGTMWVANILFNLVIPYISDRWLGWRNTVMWIGSFGCGVMTLVMLYTPQVFGNSFWAMTVVGIFFGIVLCGFVPLTALVTSLAPNQKGSAMAVVSFGAGMSYFIAPAIVGAFIGIVGVHGVMWIFAGLYFLGAVLMKFMKSSDEEKQNEKNYLSEKYTG